MDKDKFPLITIGTFCYNNGKFILDTLDSIKRQTYLNIQHIIIDDCSKDDSVQLIDKWIALNEYKCTFIKRDVNKGLRYGVQQAFDMAEGEYYIGAADDIWEDDFLEQSIAAFKSVSESVGVVYSKSKIYYYNDKRYEGFIDPIDNSKKLNYPRHTELFQAIGEDRYFLQKELVQDQLFWINNVNVIPAIIKKEVFKNKAFFFDKYWLDDYPLWFNVSRKYDFVYIDRVYTTYIKYDHSVTVAQVDKIDYDIIKILLDNFSYIKYPDTRRVTISKIIWNFISLKDKKMPMDMKYGHFIFKMIPYSFIYTCRLFISKKLAALKDNTNAS